MDNMNKLLNIFEREKERVGKDFTIFYNEKKNSIQYSARSEETDKVGVLTVVFNPKTMGECFYFTTKDERKPIHGIGELVFQTAYAGQIGKGDSNNFFPITIKEKMGEEVGDKFVKLIQSYQFDRKAIGIENAMDKKQQHKKFELGLG